MMFPANFIIETISSFGWVMMNVGFYLLIFEYTDQIGAGGTAGGAWDKYQFFVFIATSMFINSIVQMFFMTNADEFSELIRTGGLDFALLKPIDTQFLDFAAADRVGVAGEFRGGGGADGRTRCRGSKGSRSRCGRCCCTRCTLLAGVGILYSLTIVLAAASVWLGRNTSIYDFWFYITTFSRYPMEIYSGPIGGWLRWVFHVRAADSDRGQRAGPDAGQAAAAGVLLTWRCSRSWPRSSASSSAAGCSSGRC